ncbi:MAG: ABC transporter ATP-binding protein [bacterium]|nr:ABC transporter ATP-binding protein [bacterium]
MKYLSKKMKKYWYFYLLAFSCMMGAVLLDMLAPQITQSIIDDVIVGKNTGILLQLLFGLLGIGVGRAIFQYVKEYTLDCVGVSIGCQIRKELFDHIQSLSMGYFDRHNTGELMARIKDDVERIWTVLGFLGMLAVECLIHTILVVGCMFRISPKLTLLPLCVMPLIAVCAILMEGKLGKVYDDISEETAKLNTVAQENLSGVRTVKAFARERYEIRKFKERNAKFFDLNMEQARCVAFYQPLISMMGKMMLMAVVVCGGILVIRKELSIGELGAFVEYANNIIWPMEIVGWLSNDLAAAVASNRKIQAIFKETPVIEDAKELVKLEDVKGEIRFEKVGFSLGESKILKDIDFTLKSGHTLGIMGMTGAGKTSMINLLQRFYDVTDGRICLDGVDIRELSLQQLRASMAVVMQDVFLFSDTITQNIRTGQKETMEMDTVSWAARHSSAHGFIQHLNEGYETLIGERGVGLSGGQKQRISIARALAKKTPILILDDSTSALDMETEKEIQSKLKEIQSVTKIIIGHRISAVKDADEILILEDGRVAERGNHESLMRQGERYYETYCVQYGEEAALAELGLQKEKGVTELCQ